MLSLMMVKVVMEGWMPPLGEEGIPVMTTQSPVLTQMIALETQTDKLDLVIIIALVLNILYVVAKLDVHCFVKEFTRK